MDLADIAVLRFTEGLGSDVAQFGHSLAETAYSISRGSNERPCTDEGQKQCPHNKKKRGCNWEKTGDCLAEK